MKNRKQILVAVILLLVFYAVNVVAQDNSSDSAEVSYVDLVALEDVAIESEDDVVTGHDYLSEVEQELLAYDENKLTSPDVIAEEHYFDDCVELAVKKHLPIEIAEDKISLHKRKLFKAIRDMFPGMSLFYEHNRGFKLTKADPTPGDRQNQWFRSEKWRMSLYQPIFKGGSLLNTVNKERANVRGAEAEYEKVFLDLSVEVARAFFNLSKSQTVLSYRESLLTIAKDSLVISEEKMKAQLISEIEHLNVQSQESQIQHDLEVAKEDIALALVDLQKVLHLDVNEPIEVVLLSGVYSDAVNKEREEKDKEEEQTEEDQKKKIDGLVEIAYENRPEFIIQKSKLDAAIFNEKAAMAGWFPQINAQYELGQKAEGYVMDDNNVPWDEEHRVSLDVRWNVMGNTLRYVYDKNKQGTGVEATNPGSLGIDGYYDRKNMLSFGLLDGTEQFIKTKEAEISKKEAMLELELSEKDIISEVKESYYNYNRSLIQLKSVYKKLAYRDKLVNLAKHRSEINEIQISEYIQAEIDLINERDTLYKAMVDFFLAKISLNKSIGIRNYFPVLENQGEIN